MNKRRNMPHSDRGVHQKESSAGFPSPNGKAMSKRLKRLEERYSEELNLGLPVDDPSPNADNVDAELAREEFDDYLFWTDLSRELSRYFPNK